MTAAVFQKDILFWQRILSSSGFYTGKLDGSYGPMTHNAEAAFDRVTGDIAKEQGTFDPRSESVILSLVPKAQLAARKFMNVAKKSEFTVKLLSGTRSYAEQDRLFAHVPKVTNARGGQSWHNFGIAFDVGIFRDGVYFTGKNRVEDMAYATLAELELAALPELEWGGSWHFVDMPHYQLKTGKTVSQARQLLESGKPYV